MRTKDLEKYFIDAISNYLLDRGIIVPRNSIKFISFHEGNKYDGTEVHVFITKHIEEKVDEFSGKKMTLNEEGWEVEQ